MFVYKELVFKCETVTPMFMAGSDGKTAELRPPSIKGALRFWWRAMHGNLDLKDLKQKEAEIFGGTEKGQGKSKVGIRIVYNPMSVSKEKFPFEKTISNHKGKSISVNILDYLSFGPCTFRRGEGMVFNRSYIKEKTQFKLILRVIPEYEEKILESLKGLYTFGNLGSKARNGFGSIKIDGLQKYKIDRNSMSTEIPSYFAFSQHIRMFCTKQNHLTWNKALAEIGVAYKNAREQLDIPHNYHKRQYVSAPIITRDGQKSILDRHGKPYFLHVDYDYQKNQYTGTILFLKSKYAEGIENDKINHARDNKRYIDICDELNNYLSQQLVEVSL